METPLQKQGRMSTALLALIGGGLLLRFLLVYISSHGVGMSGDVIAYANWIQGLITVGPSDFYETLHSDYPPGYLYVLWILGNVDQAVASLADADLRTVVISSVKIPPILLDAGICLMIYHIVRRWLSDETTSDRTALLAVAIYAFNPVICYDSAIWGQTDSVGIFVMLATVLALMRGPPEMAAGVAVIAGLLKPQFGFVTIPLVGIVLLKRHLSPKGSVRLVSSAAVAILVFYAVIAPFDLTPSSFISRMADTVGGYRFLTVNAFNPWALVGSGDMPALVFGSIGAWTSDETPLLGSVPGVAIGTALMGAGFLVGVVRLLWRTDARSIVLVGAFLCICFFILPTRVHERYVIPAFAFFSLLVAVDRRWFWATIALAVGSLMNLHAVLSDGRVLPRPAPNYYEEISRPLPLGEFFQSPLGISLSIALQTAVFAFTLWALRPERVQRPDGLAFVPSNR